MKPTIENYYTKEIQSEYITNSKLKRFFGSPAFRGCEARAMAELRGEWIEEIGDALLIGLYVESYFEGTMDELKKEYGHLLYKKDGELYAKFEHANKVIRTGLSDPMFMDYLSGDQQTVLTGELFGRKFMCRLDRINHEVKTIVDLKVMKGFESEWVYDPDDLSEQKRIKMNFIKAAGYLDQLAIYSEIVFQNYGERYNCYIAGLSKEKEPDKIIVFVPQSVLDERIKTDDIGGTILESPIHREVNRYVELTSGQEQPKRCEHCDYCRATKKLSAVTHYNDL